MCKTIEDVPTTEFDKFLNPKLKKEIEYYYQHAEDDNHQDTLEIVETSVNNQLWTADHYGDQGTSINVDPKTFQIVD